MWLNDFHEETFCKPLLFLENALRREGAYEALSAWPLPQARNVIHAFVQNRQDQGRVTRAMDAKDIVASDSLYAQVGKDLALVLERAVAGGKSSSIVDLPGLGSAPSPGCVTDDLLQVSFCQPGIDVGARHTAPVSRITSSATSVAFSDEISPRSAAARRF